MAQRIPGLCRTPEKKVFLTLEEAKRACRGGTKKYLVPYECRCGKWHLTNKRRAKRFRINLSKTGEATDA